MLNYETIIGRAKELFAAGDQEMKSCIEQAVNEIVTNEELSEFASLLDVTKDDLIKDICKKCEEIASKECKKCAELEKQIARLQTELSAKVEYIHELVEVKDGYKKQIALQENTINNLVEDFNASKEWYKQQLTDTEEQNKRVLEKLDLIVRSNQELEKENQQLKNKLHTSEQETMHFHNKYFAENQIAIEQLEQVKEKMRQDVTITAPASELKKLADYLHSVDDYIDNQIKQLREATDENI